MSAPLNPSALPATRYELVVGERHPYFDRYGHGVRLMMFHASITNHLYIADDSSRVNTDTCDEILNGDIRVSCYQLQGHLYLRWRFGRLAPILSRVNRRVLSSGLVDIVPESQVRNGFTMQVHVVDFETGVLCATRQFDVSARTTRVLHGAISRYRNELVREEGGTEPVLVLPETLSSFDPFSLRQELSV